MSRSALVRLFFGDDHHDFRLGIGQLEELQELTGEGPAWTQHRLASGSWRIVDLKETLRLGLVGATDGKTKHKEKARQLVERHVQSGDLLDQVLIADAVLKAALVGVEEEPVGEGEGETGPVDPISPSAGSASPTSTDRPPS